MVSRELKAPEPVVVPTSSSVSAPRSIGHGIFWEMSLADGEPGATNGRIVTGSYTH